MTKKNGNPTKGKNENVNSGTEKVDVQGMSNDAQMEKATQILRARMPRLAAAGLNFEKRSGNFFTASLVTEKVKDADGNDTEETATGADGMLIEKVRRLVVEIVDKNGDLLPQYKECENEIAAKRAAALVADGEKRRKKLAAERAAAAGALEESTAALIAFDDGMMLAREIVEMVELPERAVRATATARLTSAEDEIAKLRTQLIAMGIDPDTLT